MGQGCHFPTCAHFRRLAQWVAARCVTWRARRCVAVACDDTVANGPRGLRALEEEPHRKLDQIEAAEPAWPRQEGRRGMSMHGGVGGGRCASRAHRGAGTASAAVMGSP
eukprot:scaffold24863_cov62-Phaeocystis_antarctica.AAC.3